MSRPLLPVLWTNDDIHHGRAAQLQRHLDFCDRHGIPGIFFVIPRQSAGDLDTDLELLRMIEKARSRGHEFYQHGFIHTAYECGVPDLAMLDFSPPTRALFDEQRLEIEASHTFEAQVEMIENGRRIWRRAFGEDSKGFRPGWGAFCTGFYKALAALGFEWVSSRIPSMTSWQWNQGLWDRPIDFREGVPTRPQRLPQGIWEYPIGGDYGFHVPNHPHRIDAMTQLGLDEFEVYYERQDPMLIVSHWHGLERTGETEGAAPSPTGTGYAVHEKLIPALQATGRARFVGMNELSALYQCGAQSQLA